MKGMKGRMTGRRLGLALIAAALAWGLWPAFAPGDGAGRDAPAPVFRVESREWKETSAYDPGGIAFLLRNPTDRPQRIEQVALDGFPVRLEGVDAPLPVAAASAAPAEDAGFRPVYWARLWPAEVPPGGLAELSLKLVSPLARAASLDIRPENAPALSLRAHPGTPDLSIALAVFSPALDRLYVYAGNAGKTPLTLAGIEVDGRAAAARFFPPAPAPGERAVAVVRPGTPWPAGARVFVKVVAADGSTAHARLRAFGGFPLATQFGASPAGFGLDPGTYTLATPDEAKGWTREDAVPVAAPPSGLRAVLPLDCPLCPLGMVNNDRHDTARELLRRYAIATERFPNHPALVHVCRMRAEEGYALFADAVDMLSFNPSTTWADTTRGRRLTPQQVVERLCGHGSRAAAPRPFIGLADTARLGERAGEDRDFATPYEFRTRMFTMLGLGAKGMLYRHNDAAGTSPAALRLNPSIAPLNAEVRAVRDWLAIACPWPGAAAVEGWDGDGLKAYPLLAGDAALVVFLVRQEATPTAAPAGSTVTLRLNPPPGAVIGQARRATPEGLSAPLPLTRRAGKAEVAVAPPEAAEIIVALFEPRTPEDGMEP